MKFSIVTPVYNGEKYIAETIESILSQEGDFEIEYIIADGGSTDGTLSIIKSYDEKLKADSYPIKCSGITFTWFSEKDAGMYDAIEKGFARTNGDVCAYLNADDQYLPGAFATISNILKSYPEIEWLKGINTTCDENGNLLSEGACRLYRQDWLQKGVYGRGAYFVQQDSVFWKQSLWEKTRPKISPFRFAGDYALWVAFSVYAPLWSYNKSVSIFRERSGQLSENMKTYRQEQEVIASHHFFLESRIMGFFTLIRFLGLDPKRIPARLLFSIFFPFSLQQEYIDFDPQGNPAKKKAISYIV